MFEIARDTNISLEKKKKEKKSDEFWERMFSNVSPMIKVTQRAEGGKEDQQEGRGRWKRRKRRRGIEGVCSANEDFPVFRGERR